ncbi:MAG: hypothetical protein FWD32_01435 [Firmicutes bacterium]|nr:hypothetical protein [Bacillota bacterium]
MSFERTYKLLEAIATEKDLKLLQENNTALMDALRDFIGQMPNKLKQEIVKLNDAETKLELRSRNFQTGDMYTVIYSRLINKEAVTILRDASTNDYTIHQRMDILDKDYPIYIFENDFASYNKKNCRKEKTKATLITKLKGNQVGVDTTYMGYIKEQDVVSYNKGQALEKTDINESKFASLAGIIKPTPYAFEAPEK